MSGSNAQPAQALDARNLSALKRLSPAQRQAYFRRNLVDSKPIEVHEDEMEYYLSPKLAAAQFLRLWRTMGHDEAGRRLVNEANEVYYGENEFHVRLRHLYDFLQNTGGDVDPEVPVGPLVRGKVTIELELHDIWHSSEVLADFGSAQDAKSDYHDEENGEIARWTRGRLRNVALLTNAESILVVLLGVGVIDGSDLGTHQTIKDIASVVRALIEQFGSRFDITKVLTRGQDLGCSVKSYWDRPSAEARLCVFNGRATTEQLMQVEIARWLDEDVREPGPDGQWDRLV